MSLNCAAATSDSNCVLFANFSASTPQVFTKASRVISKSSKSGGQRVRGSKNIGKQQKVEEDAIYEQEVEAERVGCIFGGFSFELNSTFVELLVRAR